MLGYITEATGYLGKGVLAIGVFLLLYEGYLLWRGRRISWWERGGLFLLGIYLIVVLSVTVSPVYGFSLQADLQNMNIIPLKVIGEGQNNSLNLLGNIVMFLPIGLMLPMVSRKMQHGIRAIRTGAELSILIEAIQLFLKRGTDIDDVILNTLGTAIGYLIAVLLLKQFPFLKQKIGIESMKNGKKLRRDSLPLLCLGAIVLCSVFVVGYEKRKALLQDTASYAKEVRQNAEVISDAKQDGTTDLDLESGTKKVSTNEEKDKNQSNKKEHVLNIEEKLTASNIYVVKVADQEKLYGRNEEERIAPASTTKMLTALTVLNYCELEEVVTVGDEIALLPAHSSVAGFQNGNEVTIEQLLEGLLLPSGGDAAFTLAAYTGRRIAGQDDLGAKQAVDTFVDAMNALAKEIGAKHSCFQTPDGYDEEGQYSTAKDLAQIAVAFMDASTENGILREIVQMERSRVCTRDGRDITWENTNLLLNENSAYYYENAIGLKTGSTDKAGKCLVSAAVLDGEEYIAVVMGDTEEGRFKDTIALYEAIP
ncbi:VanZ family protein [Anaerosporobacter faecicola]|uniref:VanZ family protein n=1 Tax=Anaerosporobacter faecicola TaxID=2718714 RepID=UPI00143AE655|nr:VanZ family protein [Anaerosporobacter faecicola]